MGKRKGLPDCEPQKSEDTKGCLCLFCVQERRSRIVTARLKAFGKQNIEVPESMVHPRRREIMPLAVDFAVTLYLGLGAKYPLMSSISCVELDENASIDSFVVGTMAMLEAITPSSAFSVDTNGCASFSGHSVRNPKPPVGTTVAFSTKASALEGIPQELPFTLTGSVPFIKPLEPRVSSTRHGVTVNSAWPPAAQPAGAKYPLISITTSVLLEPNTLISLPVPAGTMAAFATTGLFGETFSVETPGHACPVGQALRYPSPSCGTAVKFREFDRNAVLLQYSVVLLGVQGPMLLAPGRYGKIGRLGETGEIGAAAGVGHHAQRSVLLSGWLCYCHRSRFRRARSGLLWWIQD